MIQVTQVPPARGRYFEDFEVGDRWVSAEHRVGAGDVADFARITGDANPLHLDPAAAEAAGLPGTPVHGLLGAALATGLLSPLGLFDGTVVALVSLDRWRFERVLRVGDPVRSRMTVLELRPSRGRPQLGVLRRSLELIDDGDRTILGGEATMLVKRRGGTP